MRTKEQLNSKEFHTDLKTLSHRLNEVGVKHILRDHPVVIYEPQTLDLLGYFPTGTHQIIIGDGEKIDDNTVSIIRGMCSFGDFELYGNKWQADRFETEEEVIKEITQWLATKI